MRPLNALVRESQKVSLRAARQSQAIVIQGVARVAGQEKVERPRMIGRAWRLQLSLVGRLAGDPAQLIDSIYVHAQRLVSLNQEFTHRILEVLDDDEPPVREPDSRSNVIPLLTRRGG